MAKGTIGRKVVKDILIVVIGVIIIWISIQAVFGTQNPFYVVASGSMVPELSVYDVLIVQGHAPFEEVKIGDIIVFDRPSDHNRVIVHRVVSVTDDDPRTLRTKGDANSASIPGTDYPITEKEYIGTVTYVIPQIGYVTQILKPPVNYIIIVVVVGIMIAKQLFKKKSESPGPEESKAEDAEVADSPPDKLPRLEEIEKDSEYSKHTEQDVPEDAGNVSESEDVKKESADTKDKD